MAECVRVAHRAQAPDENVVGSLSRSISVNHEAGKEANAVFQISRVQHLPNENQAFDSLSDADAFLRNQNQTGLLCFWMNSRK